MNLLHRVRAALERVAAEPGVEEDGRAVLREAAGEAATAAGALLAIREG